jgi:diguanylate cyclase (GGDEF)-like protein
MHRCVAAATKEVAITFRMRGADGSWRHVEQRLINLLDDADVQGLVVNLRDVTEQHELQQTLLRASVQDALTGLPNRTLLLDRIEQTIERERAGGPPYGLMFVNLDRLQGINDAFGHSVGDDVIKCVADTLFAGVRTADTVARYAGDEFAVLLSDVSDVVHAELTAQRIAESLNATMTTDGTSVRYSASIGLAYGPAPTAEALISSAVAAMTRAKEQGRGRFTVLGDRLQHRVRDRRQLGGDLAKAVAEEELAVHYQPIVALGTGRIAGFEALVRWPHPERGRVAPADFLPLAETLDLQVPIDEWVLREACRTAASWPHGSAGVVPVAVNVAPAHLTRPGFAAHIQRTLAAAGLQPEGLILEITETAVVADVGAAAHVLRTLTDAGVRIAIDDFGTGYSSMLQLRQLPFDRLKIDREFVRSLPRNQDDIAICASVISLASRLGVEPIAEGVETPEQAALLASLDCRFGQGFLWSPAVPADEAGRLLEGAAWQDQPARATPRPTMRGVTADPALTARVRSLHDTGASLHSIAAWLNSEGRRTPSGKRWHPATVARVLYRREE